MQRVIIIDDELKGRIALMEKLKAYCPDVELIGEAASGFEGLDLIEKLKPDVVFLDIEMPGMSGFEMLNKLNNQNFYVIFTTAYDQYAIKAIKYAAFDYLLKPIDIEELKDALLKIKHLKKDPNSNNQFETKKQIELLNLNSEISKTHFSKLAISTMDGLSFYNIDEIIHLEASSNYTNLYLTENRKVLASKTLKEFEELLPSDIFFRSHHSNLINLNFIKKYIKGDGGQIELTNGNYVDVSRRKKDDFLRLIK